MNSAPLYTIKLEKFGCRIAGPRIPSGCWKRTTQTAVAYARQYLAPGAGCQIEVYDADGNLAESFQLSAEGNAPAPFTQMTATAETLKPAPQLPVARPPLSRLTRSDAE